EPGPRQRGRRDRRLAPDVQRRDADRDRDRRAARDANPGDGGPGVTDLTQMTESPAEADELRDEHGVVIHRAKLPIRLPSEQLHVRPGADGVVTTDPARAGWRYLSFRAFSLAEGEALLLDRPEQEAVVVTISGGGVDVGIEGSARVWRLPGRPSVFE